MKKNNIHNVNVSKIEPVITPADIKELLPLSKSISQHIYESRETIKNIIDKKDSRPLVIIGPCSIHDIESALEYAERLNQIRIQYQEKMVIVMRVYFEKPRTTIGWKGLINDPYLDQSNNLSGGIKIARKLLIDINSMGLPTATEFLDTVIPQYLSELISWVAIGARTTESQPHREMSSGLSMPVGFKNATNGDLKVAFDAIQTALTPHTFIGINQNGSTCTIQSNGNPYSHIVLRGGTSGPNYSSNHIKLTVDGLKSRHLTPAILVDCSHGNSGKDHTKQPQVLESVITQRNAGAKDIIGVMIESNIHAGNQTFPQPKSNLKYGVSITDSCMSWEETERALTKFYNQLSV